MHPPEDLTTASDVMPMPRRNVAVAFADIVGFSILAAADEERITARWLSLFRGVVVPAAERLGGRIVDVQGDGTLAEFPDACSALRWAMTLHALRENEGAAQDVPIVFRVAIHAGSVIAHGDRIFGDTVNTAARLQEYGTPGGTLLSGEAAGLLPEARRRGLRDLGVLPMRGLPRSLRAYSIDPPGGVAVPVKPAPGHLPSLAVLPLLNLSGDPLDEYFATGIMEDVVASLSGLGELFIVAPDSARMFAGQNPSPQRAARTLGVRFIVSGGLRRSGGGLSASLRLTDGTTGEHLWSERIDVAEREVFQLQDHTAAQIVAGIAPTIRHSTLREALRKRPESLGAYDHLLRGLHLMAASNAEAFTLAHHHLASAMQEDPGFALPVAWMAHWHSLRLGQGISQNRQEDSDAVFAFADRALALEPRNALALAILGHNSAYLRGDTATALGCFDRALAACPNSAIAWTLSSATLSYTGRGGEAARNAEQGLRLSPYDPLGFYQHHFLSIAHYTLEDLEAAEREGRVAIGGNPAHASSWRVQAATLAAQRRLDEAREAAARLLTLEPDFRVDDYASQRMPFRGGDTRERFTRDLRAAGLPG